MSAVNDATTAVGKKVATDPRPGGVMDVLFGAVPFSSDAREPSSSDGPLERPFESRARSAGIGAAMAGGARGGGDARPRQEGDWYPTPSDVTEVLLDRMPFEGDTWEPCCGDGSLARVLEARGHHVIGTDLHDRGYGDGHGADYDVLKADRLLAPTIVTNPPFNIAAPIIRHLLSLGPDRMALLLKSSFWHAKGRTPLFVDHPPSRIIALTWRPDFLNLKRPTMEVMWCVWERGHTGATAYELAGRPSAGGARRRVGSAN